MQKLVTRKRIVIEGNGNIGPLGVIGPVDRPYFETLEKIAEIIQLNFKVFEVLNNGEKVRLNMVNFDKNINEESSMVSKYENAFGNKRKKVAITRFDDAAAAKQAIKYNNSKAYSEKPAAFVPRRSPKVTKIDDSGKPNKRFIDEKKKPPVDVIDKK